MSLALARIQSLSDLPPQVTALLSQLLRLSTGSRAAHTMARSTFMVCHQWESEV